MVSHVWQGSAIGLLDLDAFFASVEQLDHPAWRGKPVIVGGSAEKRGVVSTASYEARPFGVHSAMPAAEARRLCPQAIWTRGHFDRYHELSDQVMDLISNETPRVEQVSIDEAFFDVTPGRYANEDPIAICKRIQERVACLGISCSIGLATTKTIAKIASDRNKPRGLTVVPPGSERAFMAPLPLRALSGIGAATENRLLAMGICTLGDLGAQTPEAMQNVFGIAGPRLVERARGSEHSPVRERALPPKAKSVSNERTFARDLMTNEDICAAIRHVAGVCGRRLRRKGLKGKEVTLKLRFDVAHIKTAQCRLPFATNDEAVFGKAAIDLLGELWHSGMPVRLIGVGVSHFDEPSALEQPSLFGEDQKSSSSPAPSRPALGKVSDSIKAKFGDSALAFGHDLRFMSMTSDTQPINKDHES